MHHEPSPTVAWTQRVAVASLLGLILLGLAWELWLAPTGNRTLVLKVLPLTLPLAGLLKRRLYTYRWVSLVVWLYFIEGVVRAVGDRGLSAQLAMIEILLCLSLFAACAAHVHVRLRRSPEGRRMTLEASLRGIVGSAHVLQGGDLAAYEIDWRKRYHGRARLVVRPATTAEVAAVVQACAAAGAAIVPQGGNTGLVGASVPDGSGTQVLMHMGRLNRIRAIDGANLTMTVEAGCLLQAVQEAAAAQGWLFPLSLAAEGSCTIGGNLATNAGGTQVVRYGNARDLCLGLEVVTAEGEVWDGLSGLRKDNTGYDLRDLFIGSEGTLGLITAATLKLYPLPTVVTTALASLDWLDSAVAFLGLAQARLGASLTGFEVMNRFSLDLVRRHFPQLAQPLPGAGWTVLLEQSGNESEAQATQRFESLLEAAMERGLITDAAVASSLEQAKTLWHLREAIPLAQSLEGLNIKHDISVPISRIPAFVRATDEALERAVPGVRLVDFGHLGDGNLHYNVQAPAGMDAQRFLAEHEERVNDIVYDAVMAHGGSISAEHGIGALKRDELARRKSPVALKLMRAIKQALDPHGRMNPGRVV